MTYEKEIGALREKINMLNVEIVKNIAERVMVAMEIGAVKHRHNKPIEDRNREEKIHPQVRGLAAEAGIDSESVERVFMEIIALCTRAEREQE